MSYVLVDVGVSDGFSQCRMRDARGRLQLEKSAARVGKLLVAEQVPQLRPEKEKEGWVESEELEDRCDSSYSPIVQGAK
jgi:hypothetical protein